MDGFRAFQTWHWKDLTRQGRDILSFTDFRYNVRGTWALLFAHSAQPNKDTSEWSLSKFPLQDDEDDDEDDDPTCPDSPNWKPPDFGIDFDAEPDLFPPLGTNYKDPKWVTQYGTKFIDVMNYFQSLGFSDDQLNVMLHNCPDVFTNNCVESIREKLHYLSENFYLKGRTMVIFIAHVPFLLRRSISELTMLLEELTELIQSQGLNLKDIENEDLEDWENWPPPITRPTTTRII